MNFTQKLISSNKYFILKILLYFRLEFGRRVLAKKLTLLSKVN